MLTRRTIEAAASATLEFLSERFDATPPEIAAQAVAEEMFADVAVHQLLRLTGDGMRARSAWAGYQGTSVARQLLDLLDENWNRWEPAMTLAVADAAAAIAQESGRATAALLFRVHKDRANALRGLCQFRSAFGSLDKAEEFIADTKSAMLHQAILANSRAAVSYEMGELPDAQFQLFEAREGFLSCGDAKRVRDTFMLESAIHYGTSRFDEAIRYGQRALADAEAVHDEEASAMLLGNLGMFLASAGEVSAARRYLDRAEASYAVLGWTFNRPDLLAVRGLLDIREYGIDGLSSMEPALAEYERLGRIGEKARTQVAVAEEILKVEPGADITQMCEEAYACAVTLGMERLADSALRILENSARYPSYDARPV